MFSRSSAALRCVDYAMQECLRSLGVSFRLPRHEGFVCCSYVDTHMCSLFVRGWQSGSNIHVLHGKRKHLKVMCKSSARPNSE